MAQLNDILKVRPDKHDTPAQEARAKLIIDSKKDTIALSLFLLQDNPNMVRCGDNIYSYNGKCYDLISPTYMLEIIHKFLLTYNIPQAWSRRRDVIESVLSYEYFKKTKKMNDYPDLICVNNGILNIRTKELIPHDPQYFFDTMINIDYLPEDKNAPNFVGYLQDTFNNNIQVIETVVQLGGYLLDSECKAGKMFLFDGQGGSGKSTLIDTFSLLFDEKQVTALPLDELASGSFDKECLISSRVNLSAEQKKGYIDSEEIKKIITCDLIKVSRKFKLAATFRPKTKIIVACNGLPKFTDTSDAIYRRLVIIRFTNQYRSAKEIEISGRKHFKLKNPKLIEEIKKERSAILNLFLEGLLKLRSNEYEFDIDNSSYECLEEFKKDSDTVREFLEENYVIDEQSSINIMDIYNHYRFWYRINVQDSSLMKFRVNEMGKRITEVFNINRKGREKFRMGDTNEYQVLSVYGLKRITIAPPDDFVDGVALEEAPQGELGI